MNFAQIVKKKSVRENEIELIQSQAETELSRELSISEQSLLFSKFPQSQLCQQILKVCIKIYFLQLIILIQYGYGFLKFSLLLCNKPELSCEVSQNVTPGDGDCLIHGEFITYLGVENIDNIYSSCRRSFEQ